jgi:hypothetical protein
MSRSIGQEPARVMQTVTAVRVVVPVFGAVVLPLVVLGVVAFGVVSVLVVLAPTVDGRFDAGPSSDLAAPAELFADPPAVVNWPGPPPDDGADTGAKPDDPLPRDVASPAPPAEAFPPPPWPNEGACIAVVEGPPGAMSVLAFGMLMQLCIFLQISPLMCGVLDATDVVVADADARDLARIARAADVEVESVADDGR